MNNGCALNRALAVVIAVGFAAACRGEAPPAPAPTPNPTPPGEALAADAGEAGASAATSEAADDETSNSSVADAAPDAARSAPKLHQPGVASDAGRKKLASDAGDAGDGGTKDAGAAPTVRECSSLDSEGPNELGLCADKHEDWCESDAVVAACEDHAASRDEGVFAAYLDCLDAAFEDPDLCDGDDSLRLAAAATCVKRADEVACVEHTIACEVYEGCDMYTVAECDADVARFNSRYLRYGAPYFECPTPPAVALGE